MSRQPAATTGRRPPGLSPQPRPGHAPPRLALRAIQVWSRLHGLVLLEIEGNLAAMGLDPAMIFDIEVAALQRI